MSEPDHKRCLDCGYILDGLPEPRCPECGRAFDPNDPLTYAASERRPSGRPLLGAAILACAAQLFAYLAARSANFRIDRTPPIPWPTIQWLSFGAAIIAACVVIGSLSALRRPLNENRHRGAFALALVLGALVLLAFFGFCALPTRVVT